jgi:hypothetical protein
MLDAGAGPGTTAAIRFVPHMEAHMSLRLVVDNAPHTELLDRTVRLCDALIAERESELLADLDYYNRKLRDLANLDPGDHTGLRRLYRLHVLHIGQLLVQLDARPATAQTSIER